VRIVAGSRLDDAVRAAGGFTVEADITSLNLAGRVGDGEHITIPHIPVETIESALVGTPVVSSNSGLINIDTASVVELEQLPDVGQVIAQRIVDFREINQGFDSIDQLVEIEGISPEMVDVLRPLVTIDD
jgi:competence protein ComEA